ncbi:hypothetical protein KHP62_21575, partial [Rhodobacteraceae bacterium NNCM2]|nr:hypothetical protein [Coraliihabitans acroporae]
MSEVIGVRDTVVFWLLLSGGLSGFTVFLSLGLSNSFTGLLIGELSTTFGSTPAMSSLLLGITSYSTAVTVELGTSASTTSATSTTFTSWVTILSDRVIGWLALVVGAASVTVTECTFVSGVSSTTSTTSVSYRSLGCWCLSSSIALGVASWSLIDNLHWWLWLLVGIIFVVVAEELVKVLGSDTRHLDLLLECLRRSFCYRENNSGVVSLKNETDRFLNTRKPSLENC